MTVVKSEPHNLVNSAKDWTGAVTTDVVSEHDSTGLDIATAELISGNIGTVSVTARVVCGTKRSSMTLEITSTEWCTSSWVHGVEPTSIFGLDGTVGVTVKVE